MFPFKKKRRVHTQTKKLYYSYSLNSSTEEDMNEMSYLLSTLCETGTIDIVFLCIGSDRSTGDSFGPFVGTMLKEKNFPYHVFGTIEEPVHALNLEAVLKEINSQFNEPIIFSVDACLGDNHQIGSIILKDGPLIPGNAINNPLPEVGNYQLKAIVNYLDPSCPTYSLNNTRLSTVMSLAKITSTILLKSVQNKNNIKMTMNPF
ncbi:spore protease YyaC [Psychrobacillus sp. FJAT-21963]|uniref:spore protease YyaC n=1 Tax=Psychrobacillus sp. FJAT-21963 TaxID=1712028 RepID=UPI000A65859B|nr:spore protease YyaC [Psychrobacillus sp. FJAT-21963]